MRRNFNYHFTTFTFYGVSLVVYLLFFIVPAIMGFAYSFTSWNGINSKVTFIGLQNYVEAFSDARLFAAIVNTLKLTFIQSIFFNFAILVLSAVIERSKLRFIKGALRSLFFLPYLISFVVIAVVWTSLLSYRYGVVSTLLNLAGLGDYAVDWFGNPQLVIYTIVIINLWAFSGYFLVTYISAIQTIPAELYESAQIDGANAVQSFINVTFPMVAPAFTVNFIVSIAWSLSTFEPVMLLTKGGPGFASETISYYIYWAGFLGARQGYGTTISLLLFLATMLISIIQVKILGKREVEL